MKQVYCDVCEWEGKIIDLISFPKSSIQLCPDCGRPESICDVDSIDFKDEYSKQERS